MRKNELWDQLSTLANTETISKSRERKRKKKKILVDMTEVLPNLMENINLQTQCLPLGKWKQKDTSKTHPGQSVEKSR